MNGVKQGSDNGYQWFQFITILQILHFKIWFIGYKTGKKNFHYLFKHIVSFSSQETHFDNYSI